MTNSLDVIYVTKPGGAYKKRKTYGDKRVCECGTKLSVYNRRDVCYTCDKK